MENKKLINAKDLREIFGNVSDMTIWRWLDDKEMGFPRPIYINQRRFWRIADIDQFIARQAELGGAA